MRDAAMLLTLERLSGLQKEARLAKVDILGPSDRRRRWSAQDKAALLAEIDAVGSYTTALDTIRVNVPRQSIR
jgi:hypothetical protein